MNINYKQSNIKFNKGTVALASAGPGAKKLLTLNVKFLISSADVIIYDALVNRSILNFAKNTTILIYAGKTKDGKSCTQNQINSWLLKFSKEKKRVLRLKSGDISFFSRISQEVNFLKNNKVKIQVFSGITSSQASFEALETNFLNKAKICNFMTGHKAIKSHQKKIDYDFLKKNNGKIIIYMGVSQIKEIVKNLINSGMVETEKIAIVYKASQKLQKITKTNLKNCHKVVIKKKITSPAIIIVK